MSLNRTLLNATAIHLTKLSIRVFVLLVSFLIFVPSNALSEIINCDGIYTSHKCSEVDRKFGFSVAGLRNDDGTIKRRKQEPRAALTTSLDMFKELQASQPVKDCIPVNDGIDVRIEDATLVKNIASGSSASTVNGSIRNFSSKSLVGPLTLIVKDQKGKVVSRNQIVNSLLESSAIGFSSSLLFSKYSQNHRGVYSLSLGYAPALRCDEKKVNLADTIITRGFIDRDNAKASNPEVIKKEIMSSLQVLGKEVEKAKFKYIGSSLSESSEKVREINSLRTSICRICAKLGSLSTDITTETAYSKCGQFANDLSSI